MRTVLITFMVMVLYSFTSTDQETGSWKLLGERNVAFSVDRDVIHLTGQQDGYRKLRIQVTEGPLKIYTLKIHFANGGVQETAVQKTVTPGTKGFVIDLGGGVMIISKIEFIYETKGFLNGRSRVAVWGRK